MHKNIFLIIGLVIVLVLAWWLLSPLWRTSTLNEGLPTSANPDKPFRDNLPAMDAATRADFERRTAEMKDNVMEKSDLMPARQPVILSRANMAARAHDVSGEALFVQAGSEKHLRFENLSTINGPDLRMYLSAGLDNDDFVDLGPIRATHGNVNYPIPAGTDLNTYRYALIWCRAFGVLFSYARLEGRF